MSIQTFLNQIRQRLSGVSETPGLDAQVLMAGLLQRPRAWILAHPEAELTPEQEQRLEELLSRLEAGEPLPYVLGHWEFYGLDFFVTPAVLIPRPETELLVEQALAWLREQPAWRQAADVGTGSGCIAVVLALNIPDLHITAMDISTEALQVARQNAVRHDVSERIQFVQADVLPIPPSIPFDLICANPPYIPEKTLQTLRVSAWEPRLALDGGRDGLVLIRRLLEVSKKSLAPGGLLLFEIEANQGPVTRALAQDAFPKARIEVFSDLAGNDRLVSVKTED